MNTVRQCVLCNGVSRARGLCFRCYHAAASQVKQGKTTWAELESKGKCRRAMKGNANG